MIARAEYAPMLRAFVWAMLVHLLVVLLMFLGSLNWKPFRQQQITGMTIEAVMVDTGEMSARREKAQKAAETAEQKKQAQEKRKQELELQKEREKEVAEQKKVEEKQQRELDIQREKMQQEQKRIEAEAEAKRKAQEKLKALRVKREQERQEQKEAQQRELEKAKKEAVEAEKKRKNEAEKMKQIEAREKAEAAEQQAKADEAAKQKQAEDAARVFKAGQQATLDDNYIAEIQRIVTDNWLRPPTAQTGLRCTLQIVQIPGGEVISAAISSPCNADDATRRSIVAAVERIEALPYRGFEKVFKREIDFIFKYDGE